MLRFNCAQVWGGVRDDNEDLETAEIRASIFARAADGGKGGDIHYFSVCTEGLLTRVAVADVAGHGTAVSKVGEWLYDALVQRMNSLDGSAVLADLNRLAHERGIAAMTTAAVLTVANSTLYFCYAGHPPVLFLRRHETCWQWLRSGSGRRLSSLPLGVRQNVAFDQGRVPLAPGDRIFVHTDGLVEAPNLHGDDFGADGLLTVLDRADGATPPELKKVVLEAVCAHTGGTLVHDDVTLIAIEIR